MSPAQVLFSFKGRIPRKLYWLGIIPILPCAVFIKIAPTDQQPGLIPFVFLLSIVVIWMSLAIHIKRWHDRGKSGWWILISLVPIVGAVWTVIELGFFASVPAASVEESRVN